MVRGTKGFTLIELLIVVVIIGILAAIAIPKFSTAREKAYYSAMKSDLKNLASQEEVYYGNNYQYSASTSTLGFSASEGVTVTPAVSSDNQGWSATATHKALTATFGCAIYVGNATAPSGFGSPSAAGIVACKTS